MSIGTQSVYADEKDYNIGSLRITIVAHAMSHKFIAREIIIER